MPETRVAWDVIRPDGFPEPPFPYAPAVRAGDFVFTSGLVASDLSEGIAAAARVKPGRPFDEIPLKLQTRYIYRRLEAILDAAGTSLEQMVRLDQFIRERGDATHCLDTRNEFLVADRPVSTLVQTEGSELADALVTIDAVGLVERPGVTREVHNSDEVRYNRAGGYSQVVTAGDWVFLSGSTANDLIGAAPFDGGIGTGLAPEARIDPNYWYGSPIKAQTHFVIDKKVRPMLAEVGCTLADVVRAQVYISDFTGNYAGFLEAWREIFPDEDVSLTLYPVRALGTIGACIEVSVVAVKPESGLERRVLHAEGVPMPVGPCPQAVKAGPFVFFSTQMAADEHGFAPGARVADANGRRARFSRELEYVLANVERIARTAGGSLDSVVKGWLQYTDRSAADAAMEAWHGAFDRPPARSILFATAPLCVPECSLALDLVGYVPDPAVVAPSPPS